MSKKITKSTNSVQQENVWEGYRPEALSIQSAGLIKREIFKMGLTTTLWRKTLAGAGLIAVLPWMGSTAMAALPGGSMDPTAIPKYAESLFIPPVMPKAVSGGTAGLDYYLSLIHI